MVKRNDERLQYCQVRQHALSRRRFVLASRALSAREKGVFYSFNDERELLPKAGAT